MGPVRVLFVDDEPSIRLTLPEVLRIHGFEVTPTGTVAEALKAIHEQTYDVLLADLNIGQPGDGFTVVSAMRRTQPKAVTIILTGYPAFETALEAIRGQVDDYAVKPASVNELVRTIHSNLTQRTPHHPLPTKKLGTILRESQERLVAEWLTQVKAEPDLGTSPVRDEERQRFFARVLMDMSEYLELGTQVACDKARESAQFFARERRAQGYTASMLLKETFLIRRVILATVQAHLLGLDMSTVFQDMVRADECLDLHLRHVIESFLAENLLAA